MLVAFPSPPFLTHTSTGAAVQSMAVTCHAHNSPYRHPAQPSLAGQVLPRIRDLPHPSASNWCWHRWKRSHPNLNPARSVVYARPNNRSAPTSPATPWPPAASPESVSSLNSRERGRESCNESKSISGFALWCSLDLQGSCVKGDQTSDPTQVET